MRIQSETIELTKDEKGVVGISIVPLQKMVSDLQVYIDHVVPDTRLTIKKYLDVKYEYLSYCLKLKELDDEEVEFIAIQEPLYRVENWKL
ncbi:hypothetical protein CRE_20160 [Caenorhabditis remanei]|uniref:AH domain-containing protein n=1 Tax=Caenorhabditis remanei TaxID=31234 RepID=E3NV89_CAERE|nr:hypothetical protein CRE_20160 [Caenorhabditis remanei]